MSVASMTPSGAVRPTSESTLRDPIRASQHIFRVVLDALANPGTIRTSIVHPRLIAENLSVNPYLASVLVTLLDHEVSLHVADGPGSAELADFLVRRTRTSLADASTATFVVAHAETGNYGLPELLHRGSLEYPDDGATLLIDIPPLGQESAKDLELTMTGPGIATVERLWVSGLDSKFIESRNAATANYPMGIDLLLIDPEGRLVGMPRTTQLTISTEGVS